MKYKVGDRVKIKSIDWYNENKNEFGDVKCSLNCSLTKSMSIHCGSIQTIESVVDGGMYWMKENPFNWADEMIEGLVEEADESWRYKNIFDHSQYPQSFECPEGYIFKDENGNAINATKIILEKKKKEYPKFKVGDRIKRKGDIRLTTIKDIKDNYYIITIPDFLGNAYITDKLLFSNQNEYELFPNKFDITNLRPFDKVLVRGDVGQKWTLDFFGFMDKDKGYPFVCVGHYIIQCIPYEGNECLLGTTNDCDDFYKTWK